MWCFSQTTYPKLTSDSLIVITPQQLKATNLIFLEHKKLKLQVPELNKQIVSYESLINSYVRSDSLKNSQVKELTNYIEVSEQVRKDQLREINKLKSKNQLYKGLSIGGITISIALLITLLIR
nr:MAG TPA: hypothetical protein [Bacteriophage sp.]